MNVLADKIDSLKRDLAEESKSSIIKPAFILKAPPGGKATSDAVVTTASVKIGTNNGSTKDVVATKSPIQDKAMIYLQNKEKVY